MPTMAGSKSSSQLHFVLFPLMAQGHMIPMIDIARMLAHRGVVVTIVTTPRNAARFSSTLGRAVNSGLQIRVIELPFPTQKVGFPDGYENIDMLPSLHMAGDLLVAARGLQQPVEEMFEKISPRPNCMISDMCLPWTDKVATKYRVPRISFLGFSSFSKLCTHILVISKSINLDSFADNEYFTIPGLPDEISVTKSQLPFRMTCSDMEHFHKEMADAEERTFGVIVNSFDELEPAYVEEYKKKRGSKVWCIGPVSLCNYNTIDKLERGNSKTPIDEHAFLKWLDSQKPNSVVYVCLGSLCNLQTKQMIELGMALEAMGRPFIWVIRKGEITKGIEEWIMGNGFQERVKERGLVILGWAPQVLILSHDSIGCFLTHCGWNSTLEAITSGVPMVTWPLFAEQFLNEKLIVEVLKVAASIGVEIPQKLEEPGRKDIVNVTREAIIKAVDLVMNGKGNEEMRKRVKEHKDMAKKAIEEGGSSYKNIEQLIQDVMEHVSLSDAPKELMTHETECVVGLRQQ